MSEAEADTATLKDLCGGAGFKRIIYVDDVFDSNPAHIKDVARRLSPEQLRGTTLLDVVDVGDEFIYDTVEKIIDEVVSDADRERLLELLAAQLPAEEGGNDFVAVHGFRERLGDMPGHAVRQLSMREWERFREVLIAEARGDETTLFVFDDDFRLEGRGENDGRRELQWIRSQLKDRRHATVLLTHGAPTEEDAKRLAAEIANADPEDGRRTVVISKGPLQQGTTGLVRGVKHALLNSDFLALRRAVEAALLSASKAAQATLAEMHVDQFERIIVHSSLAEGAWCPETIARVILVRQDKAARSGLRKNLGVHNLMRAIEPLVGVDTGGPSKGDLERASALQYSEVVDNQEDLAGAYLPLESGDVFQWKGKRLVLVAQTCDIAVRRDGARSREGDRLVALLEIAEHVTAPLEAVRDGDDGKRVFPIENGQVDGSNLDVSLDRAMYVPPWILDLCVLSERGECELCSESVARDCFSSWSARRAKLQVQVAKEAIALYRQIVQPQGRGARAASLDSDQRTRLARSLLRLPLGCKFDPVIELLSNDGWRLRVPELKRVQRIRERHAIPLLSAFMQHAARPAYPHSHARMQGDTS